MKLTKRLIDSLAYDGDGKSRSVHWDDALPGFGIRVYPTGRKAFVLSYRAKGRKHLMTLGTYGPMTLAQGRNLAKTRLADVITGGDPLEARKKAAAGSTIGDLAATYMTRHAKPLKRSWKDDQRRLDRHILPRWRNHKVLAITRDDVASLHSRIGKSASYEANRTVALLSKMFELARLWGFVPDSHPNPARGIDKFREEKRDRWVTPEELPTLAEAINAESNDTARAAIWLYLLLGVRKSELLRAKWADIDFERCELKLPETKAGRVHYVPLSPPALAILKSIPRVEGNPYVLPGRKPRDKDADKAPPKHFVNISKPWQRVRNAAGIEDVRLHDLRRTVGSWLAQSGATLHLIGRVLNHSNTSTTAIYARFSEDHAREALDRHAERLLGVAATPKEPAGKVVDIAGKRREG
ncbi:MAG: site-specific integrase [Gammaproteobacteria bacterium]|nr:site-specific integrase [Gammaproteobacteria bacterium]